MHRTSEDIEFKGELNQKLYGPYNIVHIIWTIID